MRRFAVFFILGAAACSAGLLETLSEPPAGLPVTVSTTFVPGIVPASGVITGKGDSVIALLSWPAVCGRTQTADAGTNASGALVITILLTSQGVQSCMPLNGMTVYRAVVHGVPAGAVDASGHVRLVTNGANLDSSIVSTTVTLP